MLAVCHFSCPFATCKAFISIQISIVYDERHTERENKELLAHFFIHIEIALAQTHTRGGNSIASKTI